METGGLGTITSDPRGRIFVDPVAYADPVEWQRIASELRHEAPVFRVEAEGFTPFWALTRHADVMSVSQQNDLFLNTRDSVLIPVEVMEHNRSMGVDLKTLIHMDGAEHAAYRKLTNDWFKPASLKRIQSTVDDLAAQFVDRLAAFPGQVDVATDIIMPFPLHVIMSILGIPEEDEPRMLKLTQEIFGAEDPEYSTNPEERDAALLATILEFGAYFDAVIKQRRSNPGQDLASVIANGMIDGDQIGDLETISYYVIVATAGHDTTAGSLSGGVEQLLRHPEQLEALRDQPELIPNAVEEIIRWSSPVRHFMRYATEDTEIRGTRIKAGDALLLSYLSANFDEDVFEEPMWFDVRRPNAKEQIAFGWGRHHCLGSQLARMELRSFLRELSNRIEVMEPNGDAQWSQSSFVGGIKHLPMRYRLREVSR
jgi:cytochrome P450